MTSWPYDSQSLFLFPCLIVPILWRCLYSDSVFNLYEYKLVSIPGWQYWTGIPCPLIKALLIMSLMVNPWPSRFSAQNDYCVSPIRPASSPHTTLQHFQFLVTDQICGRERTNLKKHKSRNNSTLLIRSQSVCRHQQSRCSNWRRTIYDSLNNKLTLFSTDKDGQTSLWHSSCNPDLSMTNPLATPLHFLKA